MDDSPQGARNTYGGYHLEGTKGSRNSHAEGTGAGKQHTSRTRRLGWLAGLSSGRRVRVRLSMIAGRERRRREGRHVDGSDRAGDERDRDGGVGGLGHHGGRGRHQRDGRGSHTLRGSNRDTGAVLAIEGGGRASAAGCAADLDACGAAARS